MELIPAIPVSLIANNFILAKAIKLGMFEASWLSWKPQEQIKTVCRGRRAGFRSEQKRNVCVPAVAARIGSLGMSSRQNLAVCLGQFAMKDDKA